eukprot:494137_1
MIHMFIREYAQEHSDFQADRVSFPRRKFWCRPALVDATPDRQTFFFQALNIPIKIVKGQIEITNEHDAQWASTAEPVHRIRGLRSAGRHAHRLRCSRAKDRRQILTELLMHSIWMHNY